MTVLPGSLIGPHLRRLVNADALPVLPEMEILLYARPETADRSLNALADVIDEVLSLPDPFAV